MLCHLICRLRSLLVFSIQTPLLTPLPPLITFSFTSTAPPSPAVSSRKQPAPPLMHSSGSLPPLTAAGRTKRSPSWISVVTKTTPTLLEPPSARATRVGAVRVARVATKIVRSWNQPSPPRPPPRKTPTDRAKSASLMTTQTTTRRWPFKSRERRRYLRTMAASGSEHAPLATQIKNCLMWISSHHNYARKMPWRRSRTMRMSQWCSCWQELCICIEVRLEGRSLLGASTDFWVKKKLFGVHWFWGVST